MKKLIPILFFTATCALLGGCYNNFGTPDPAKIWTDDDFTPEQMISIAGLKAMFDAEYPNNSGIGKSLTIGDDLVVSGRVISSDKEGNVYKSMYLYDTQSESAIEVKLHSGYYVSYAAGRKVYVRLQGLVLGNYREMLSIGVASRNPSYANGNLEDLYLVDQHVKKGELEPLTAADTLVVTPSTYSSLTDADLGRLVRFEGVTSKWGTSQWGYGNAFPNYFTNSTSYTWESIYPNLNAEVADHPTWAASTLNPDTKETDYYYGSAWFSYGDITVLQGNYVVRSSGYSKFKWGQIPADGKTVDITAIYTKFDNSSGDDNRAAYQLLLNSSSDVEVQ